MYIHKYRTVIHKDSISDIHILLTVHCAAACLGKPFTNTPTSDVVPPMSTTTALSRRVRKAAPLMLLVGPEENVSTG